MRLGFEASLEYRVRTPISNDFSFGLLQAIHLHTPYRYRCVQSGEGCFLKPIFRNMPYKNSFVPELSVVVSEKEGQTFLHITCRPVAPVRALVWVMFGLLLMMLALMPFIAIFGELDSLFPVFIPLIIAIYGYLLCKIGTMLTFRKVVNAIRKEFY